jgi:subtilisin family serine protease
MAKTTNARRGKKPASGTSRSTKSAALRVPQSKPIALDMPDSKQASRRSASLTVAAGANPQAQTIVYIHGIGNKPLASVLKCQWDTALFGVGLGDRSRMAYWVNRAYYPSPSDETCAAGDLVKLDDDDVSTRTIMALSGQASIDEKAALETEIEALADDDQQRDFLRALSERMAVAAEHEDQATRAADLSAKVLPLPPILRRLITRRLTRAFLRDVNDFFFNLDRREAMERSLVERLNAGGGPFVVIAHSQGSMIAYNVLRQLTKAQCEVKLFLTLGSPLGLDEVQDVFRQWVPGGRLKVPACVARWVNVAERLDPVAADNDIANDFEGRIDNFDGFLLNPDAPRHPHSGTGYLKTKAVQDAVRETVGNAFGQAVGRTIIAKDLVEEIEDSRHRERHPVLIQLARPGAGNAVPLATLRQEVTQTIEAMVAASGEATDAAELEPLKRFIAAKLTRLEIERLRTLFSELHIERVWKDAAKQALIYQSSHTVQAHPANVGYQATGEGITWAVLDTGISGHHPHFSTHENIVRQWDCTRRGAPVEHDGDAALDQHGHGTHVAGVIAGQCSVPLKKGETDVLFSGMAPQAQVYGFKVLDDQGHGHDSYIIKALDLIGDLNEQAGHLIIHGVNLSLGGGFDPSVYGCGHTPLCQELRRLWGQGVLVVLAAGNEGYATLQAAQGELPSNMDLTIGDPANLEEAIAVGSIHKTNPHTYGVSYFSSRGPTADGRRKPDVVAPGEQILSAYNNYNKKAATASDLYIEMSGTSMAAPHVSGILAAFLCMRREFISYPNRIKTLLLDNCTDLGRDRYIQGCGMPNLIKMLANS